MKELFRRLYLRYRVWYHSLQPAQALMVGYALYIAVSFVLLCLPFLWKTDSIPLIDTAFTAISSVTTAGLLTISVADDYNILGQFIILLGVQLGGMGYMTIGSLIIIASKGYLPKNRVKIGKAILAMPGHFDPQRFFKHIAVYALSIELIGALILWV